MRSLVFHLMFFACLSLTIQAGKLIRNRRTTTEQEKETILENESNYTFADLTFPCPLDDDWYYSILSDSCVKVFDMAKNFEQALQICNAFDSRLVEINDKYEEVVLHELFSEAHFEFWIGAVRTYDRRTILPNLDKQGTDLEEAAFNDFEIDDPNPGCVSIRQYHHDEDFEVDYWVVQDCKETMPFICEKSVDLEHADTEVIKIFEEANAKADSIVDTLLEEEEEITSSGEFEHEIEKLIKRILDLESKGKRRKRAARSNYDTYSPRELCLLKAQLLRISSLTMDGIVSCLRK